MSGAWGNEPVVQPDAATAPSAASWGNDPIVGSQTFRFSDKALRDASTRPSGRLVMMTPQQYLSLSPDLPTGAKPDKKGKQLAASVAAGENINEVPSLEVVTDKSGHARVTDQDGRHRAQMALDSGLTEIPVVVQAFGAPGAPIKSLTGMRDGASPIPFDFKPYPVPVSRETPPPKGVLDRLRDAVYVPKDRRDPNMETAVREGIQGVPAEIGRQAKEAAGQFVSDLSRPYSEHIGDILTSPTGPIPFGREVMDLAGLAAAPVTGAITSLAGRPIEQGTGINRNVAGNALTLMIPGGGEGKLAKAATEASRLADAQKAAEAATAARTAPATEAMLSRAATDAEHAQRVGRLRAEGIEPTAGQQRGGIVRRFEEGHKSDPLIGEAIRGQEAHANETFNRAVYNRVLEPLGVKLKPDAPVGRGSVKVIGDMVSNAYDRLKPKMRLAPDDEMISGLADIRTRVGELPPAQQAQFEAILNNRVLHRLGETGAMDGDVFKLTESDISRLARDYKGAPDPAQRGLGNALEDVMGVLRENLERSSDPGIRGDLQKVNKSWALLTRLEDAAQARRGSQGVITPGDLLSAVRRGDRSVRHRGFSRGDAMLQGLGEDADAVLGNKLPDSGTPERLNIGHNGLLTYLAGRLTNPAASGAMNILRRAEPHIPSPQNNFLRTMMNAPPTVLGNLPQMSAGQLPATLGQASGQ